VAMTARTPGEVSGAL